MLNPRKDTYTFNGSYLSVMLVMWYTCPARRASDIAKATLAKEVREHTWHA